MRCHFTLFGLAVCAATLVGCSGGGGEQPVANKEAVQPQKKHPAADSAQKFLSAVVKGDGAAATKCLTPRAVEQFESQGKRFAFPGLDNAQFQMGEVRERSATDALVQCIFTATNPDGSTASEEICCLMRKVGPDWRVSGIAYDTGNDSPPVIVDFETFRPDPHPNPQNVAQETSPSVDIPHTAQAPPSTQPQ